MNSSIFSGNSIAFFKTTRFLFLKHRVKQKFKTSNGIAAVWSDNIYGKWTGLAKQNPEKYVYHHDYLPFIAQPLGRVLIRAAKKDKSIHSNWTWWLYHLHSENQAGITLKRDHLSSSLFKQKPLSEMDGKYVLAAESVVIARVECSQFCRLCHRDMGQTLEGMYQSVWVSCSPIT